MISNVVIASGEQRRDSAIHIHVSILPQDEMVGWHHQLNGHEFEQAPGVGGGEGSLACCSPWGHKESDMTEQLN